MWDQQRSSPASRGISDEETQQEGSSPSDALRITETVETGQNGSVQSGGGRASSSSFGAVSPHACTGPPSLSAGDAGSPTAPGREDVAASEAQREEDYEDGNRRRTHVSAVGKETEKKIRTEHHQPLEADTRAACVETGVSAIRNLTEEQTIAGAAATERSVDCDTVADASETACVSDALAAGEVRDDPSCAASYGSREEFVVCANCRRLFQAACDADSQAASTACVSGLCRDCSVECSRGRENMLQENGVRKIVRKQKVLDELGEGMQKVVAGETGGSKSGHGASEVQRTAEMGDANHRAADKTITDAEDSELQAHPEALAEEEGPGKSHGTDNKKLPQGEKSHGDSKASEDSSFAVSSCARTAERKVDTAGGKAERFAKFSAGETSSMDSEDKATKDRNTEYEVESSTLVKGSVISAGRDIKSVEVSGTCAEQNRFAEDVKSTSDVNKFVTDKSTIDSSKPVMDSKSDLPNSSSTGEKVYGLESGAAADPSIAALERSNSARESKDGVTTTQEGGGGGAEDEEEEEEEEGEFQGGLSGESEKKEYMASRKRGVVEAVTRGKPTSPRSLSPSPCHYRRKRRRGDNGAVATRCKVNVGPRHQVPALPPFFLDSSCTRDGRADGLAETRELYNHDAGDTARLVYSPFAMQRVYRKRLAEGTVGEGGIRNADEMNDFIRKVAENWTNKSGWQPFSPEYAYKLLHFAGYDPQRALRIMKDPRFCFTTICDPPQRRYDNKWRPKDRRGQIATHPYPSPLTLRAYLSRRNQHAAATAAQENASSRV